MNTVWLELTPEEADLIATMRRLARRPHPLHPPSPDRAWLGRFRRAAGDRAAERDAGKWRLRYRDHPQACEDLLTALECRLAAGQKIREPAAYLEKMWRSRKQSS